MSREKTEERQGDFKRSDTGCELNEEVKIPGKGYLKLPRLLF